METYENNSGIDAISINDFKFNQGDNTIRIEGEKDGKKYADECVWNIKYAAKQIYEAPK